MGGESNFLFQLLPSPSQPGNKNQEYHFTWIDYDRWQLPQVKNWDPQQLEQLLEKAQEILTQFQKNLELQNNTLIIRKERGVGIIPKPGYSICRELLEEIVLNTQVQLETYLNSKIYHNLTTPGSSNEFGHHVGILSPHLTPNDGSVRRRRELLHVSAYSRHRSSPSPSPAPQLGSRGDSSGSLQQQQSRIEKLKLDNTLNEFDSSRNNIEEINSSSDDEEPDSGKKPAATTTGDKAKPVSLGGDAICFSAFNGGRDVWVDIGDKKLGVMSLQKYLGDLSGVETLHVGDQFASVGANDFKARMAGCTVWIASPQETVEVMDELLTYMEDQKREF